MQKRKIILLDDHAEIPLSKSAQGKTAWVDIENIEKCQQYNWAYNKTSNKTRPGGEYAFTMEYLNGKWKKLYLHRLLHPEWEQIDHKNGSGLDNRESNLRSCNSSQNNANQKISKKNTSGYKGITWHKRDKVWAVHVGERGNNYIGSFKNLADAIAARDKAHRGKYGEFSRLE